LHHSIAKRHLSLNTGNLPIHKFTTDLTPRISRRKEENTGTWKRFTVGASLDRKGFLRMNKRELRFGTTHRSRSWKVLSLYFTQRKTSDMNATVRRLIEDVLSQCYERRAMLEGTEEMYMVLGRKRERTWKWM